MTLGVPFSLLACCRNHCAPGAAPAISRSRKPGAGRPQGRRGLTIENRGSVPDRLLSGSTGLARSIEVHEMVVSNGLMMMRPIDGGLTTLAGWQAGCAFFAKPYRRLPLFASDCSCQPTSA